MLYFSTKIEGGPPLRIWCSWGAYHTLTSAKIIKFWEIQLLWNKICEIVRKKPAVFFSEPIYLNWGIFPKIVSSK
jgi:hypothetical protein